MPPDLIVYALVAAGLVFWLRNVLGTRHGDERERHSSYMQQKNSVGKTIKETLIVENHDSTSKDLITELFKNAKDAMFIKDKIAVDSLFNIADIDKSFNVIHFLEGAQDAFVIIVESFAVGDCETLKELLDKSVYEAFEAVISERIEKKESHKSEIHAIKKAEIIEASVNDKMAYITVSFIAEETSVTKDKDGKILSGHPDKVTEMRDIWVFGHEIKSRDPRWFLYETRGDFDDDNEIIPNTNTD